MSPLASPYVAILALLALPAAGCSGAPDERPAEAALLETDLWPYLQLSLEGAHAVARGTITGKESGLTYFQPEVHFGSPDDREAVWTTDLPPASTEFAIDFGNPDLGEYRSGTGVLDLAATVRWFDLPPGVHDPRSLVVTGRFRVEGDLGIQEGWVSATTGSARIDREVALGTPPPGAALAYQGEETVVYRPEAQSFGAGKVYLTMRARITLTVEVWAPAAP